MMSHETLKIVLRTLVMLPEWDPVSKIAARLGSGRIKKLAWKHATLEKKLVVVG